MSNIYQDVVKALDAATYGGNRAKGFTIYYDFEYPSGGKGVGGIEISVKPGQDLDSVVRDYKKMKRILNDSIHKKEIKNPKIRKADEDKFLKWIEEQKRG